MYDPRMRTTQRRSVSRAAVPAQSIADDILKRLKCLPDRCPNDVFHAGDPATPVTGIVVTMTATRAVLAKAAALRANLVIAHEPTFFQDGPLDHLADDPVYRDKIAFIEANRLVVWRCHDATHRAKPDVIVAGVTEALGWDKYRSRRDRRIFDLPATTLGKLVTGVKKSLKLPAVRVTGDPKLAVRRVALSVGCPGWGAHRKLFREPGIDAILCGEVREWETCEYARDTAATTQPQGLIVLGHLNSEEPGMAYFARLLTKWFPRIPVHFVPAGDPFWHG